MGAIEKSVALFCCKNILKSFKKVFKNLLTNRKKCVIIGYTRKGKRKKEVNKMKELERALKALGRKGIVSITGRLGEIIKVSLNGEYFGLFDISRRLFVD